MIIGTIIMINGFFPVIVKRSTLVVFFKIHRQCRKKSKSSFTGKTIPVRCAMNSALAMGTGCIEIMGEGKIMFTRSLFIQRCLSGFVVLLTLSVFAFGAEDYSQWPFSAKIYLNTTAGGANITSTIANFPVLVRLTTNNFPFSQALTGGADVRFADSSGTHLPYQIERWTTDNTAAEIWVKVGQILGNNAGQYVLMYWGKTGSVDSSKGSAVFDTANGFKGVWHMGENAAPLLDATVDKYNGAKGGNMAQATGIIGNAQVFNGSADYAYMGNVLNPGTSNFLSVSAWVKRGAIGLQTIMAKSNGGAPSATYGWIFTFDPSDYLHVYVASGGATWGDAATFHVASNTALTDLTSWHHVAAVIDKSGNANCRIYIDGVDQTGTPAGNITGVAAITDTLNFRLATQSNSQYYFNGTMDEAIVSYRARSADWIKLCYQNQKPNQTFATVVENYSTWAYSTQFQINTSSSGANIASTLTNFPLLIRLTSANFPGFSQTLSGGADVRFSKANGMPLSYQIERWVDNTAAEIWVKVDTIFGNNATQSVTMYWGKTGEVSMARAPLVFDTANGFSGVWHLSNSNFNDATYNAANATNYGTTDTTAAIGNGRKFVGSDPDYMQVTGLMGSSAAVTLSCWAKVDSIDGANHMSDLVSIGDIAIIRANVSADGTRDSLSGIYHNSSGWNTSPAPGGTKSLLKAGWKYLTCVFNPSGSSQIMYINGVPVASTAYTQAFSYSGLGTNTFFGKHGNGQNMDFGGVLDEIRIEKTVHSADWIKLCYQNQNPGSSIICSGVPVITTQPVDDQNVKSGDTASYFVVVSGTNPAYQWQRSGDSGSTWTNVTTGVGVTAATYKFKTDSTVDKKAQFRCVITACGTVTSNAAKLTFATCTGGTPVITAPPQVAYVKSGDTATFNVSATGTGIVYQWQRSVNNGAWSNVTAGTGGTSPTYKFKTDSAIDANSQYHCVVSICGAVTSAAAPLVFCGITTQPAIAAGVKVGDSATFTIVAAGTGLAYQWQRLRSGGSWTVIAGQASATCRIKIDTMDTNSLYNCVVTSGCGTYTSSAAGVIVCFPIAITAPPGNQIGILVGQPATFQVQASGYRLSYQWQRSADGITWSAASGAGTTNSTYSFTVAATDNNAKFRCRVGDTCESQTSAAATLTVCAAPVIVTSLPLTLPVGETQSAVFHIGVTGTNPAFKWQRMNGNGTTWDTLPGATDSTYAFIAKLSDSGAKFRCVVTGKCGIDTSTTSTLVVYAKARANFTMTINGVIDSIGAAPCSVLLNDSSSSGGIATWIWSYGDGIRDTSSSAGAKTHQYDTGVYIVKLFTQGPGGSDSASRKSTVYSRNGNPIVITGRYLAPDSAALDFMRFSSLNASPQPPPTVASVRLWYQLGTTFPDTVNAKLDTSYSLSTLKAGGGVISMSRCMLTCAVPPIRVADS